MNHSAYCFGCRWIAVLMLLMSVTLCACAPTGNGEVPSGTQMDTREETEMETVRETETVYTETMGETEVVSEAESTETEAPEPLRFRPDWAKGEVIETGFGAGYPRMYALQDGTLLLGCDNFFGVFVARSTDHGLTWTDVVHGSGDHMGAANPAFFQDEDGTIYLGYRSTGNREDGSFYASIQVSVSTDNGLSWAHHSTVYENVEPTGVFKGIWEPHFGILGGKLTCFYANDCTDVVTDYQNIEYKQWDEASGSWGNRTIVCDGAKHRSRDGMPVWTALRSGGYVCAIEGFDPDNGNQFAIKLVYSADGVTWSEPQTVLRPTVKGALTAAPYVVELENGQLVVSCQTNECTAAGDVYILATAISDGTAVGELREAHFSAHSYPLGGEGGTEAHMWNSLYVYDGYLFACGGTASRGVVLNRYRLPEDIASEE